MWCLPFSNNMLGVVLMTTPFQTLHRSPGISSRMESTLLQNLWQRVRAGYCQAAIPLLLVKAWNLNIQESFQK